MYRIARRAAIPGIQARSTSSNERPSMLGCSSSSVAHPNQPSLISRPQMKYAPAAIRPTSVSCTSTQRPARGHRSRGTGGRGRPVLESEIHLHDRHLLPPSSSRTVRGNAGANWPQSIGPLGNHCPPPRPILTCLAASAVWGIGRSQLTEPPGLPRIARRTAPRSSRTQPAITRSAADLPDHAGSGRERRRREGRRAMAAG